MAASGMVGRGLENRLEGPHLISPLESELPTSYVNSFYSAILDLLGCFWCAQPSGPHLKGEGGA